MLSASLDGHYSWRRYPGALASLGRCAVCSEGKGFGVRPTDWSSCCVPDQGSRLRWFSLSAVLSLIFLKYVSDAFDLRREELEAAFKDPKSEYYLDRADYKTEAAYAKAIHAELEDRDYFTEQNVFWVPPLARWKTLQENAALAPDTEIEIRNGKVEKYTFRSTARLIDDALEAVEKENPRLAGIIEKNRYMQLQLEPSKLIGLISEVVSSFPFRHASLSAKDILGHVYEYFLGQFALAEGKKGGQYYTPKSIVSLVVEMLEPFSGKDL